MISVAELEQNYHFHPNLQEFSLKTPEIANFASKPFIFSTNGWS